MTKYKYYITLNFLVLFLLCNVNKLFCQSDIQLNYNREEINSAGKYRKNLPLFVEKLTLGKHTDKEKFDAIFTWVALNIKYDYYAFYSSNGHTPQSIKRTLKKKRGICLDYAYLMDTLCKQAGIYNYTVYGYAKDEVYDVNDSIFIDNHAWNAVRLDGEWYVYDVTWASGQPYYELNKFGKRIRKLLLNWPKKVKKFTIKNKFRTKYDGFCPENKDQVISKQSFTRIKYRFRILRGLVKRLPFKYVVRTNHKLDSSFYLCDPEVFVITHFPDDATWSLCNKKNTKEFTKDSTYYYLNNSMYENQNRHGVVCPDCDATYGMSPMQTNINLLDKSKKCNPSNKFISFLCEYSISNLLFQESVFINDSTQKVEMLDSSLTFVDKSRKSLDAAKKYIGKDYSLQKNKNISKRKFLVSDNITHRKYINELKKTLLKKTSEMNVVTRDINAAKTKYYHRDEAFKKLKSNFKFSKSKPNEILNEDLKSKDLFYTKEIDSLNIKISGLRTNIELSLPTFSDSIKKVIAEFYIFLSPFEQKLNFRSQFFDDYKKPIVEKRDFIERYKNRYKELIDSGIVKDVNNIYKQFYELLSLTEKRSVKRKDQFQTLSRLVKCELTTFSELESYKSLMIDENKTDLCWLNQNHFFVATTSFGLKTIKINHEVLSEILADEYRFENKRFIFIHNELSRRLRKYKNINNHNRKVSFHYKKMVRKEKQDYLKKLKKEHQTAKKASR